MVGDLPEILKGVGRFGLQGRGQVHFFVQDCEVFFAGQTVNDTRSLAAILKQSAPISISRHLGDLPAGCSSTFEKVVFQIRPIKWGSLH